MTDLAVRVALSLAAGVLFAVLVRGWQRRDPETLGLAALTALAFAYVAATVGWHLWWLGLAAAALGALLAVAAVRARR